MFGRALPPGAPAAVGGPGLGALKEQTDDQSEILATGEREKERHRAQHGESREQGKKERAHSQRGIVCCAAVFWLPFSYWRLWLWLRLCSCGRCAVRRGSGFSLWRSAHWRLRLWLRGNRAIWLLLLTRRRTTRRRLKNQVSFVLNGLVYFWGTGFAAGGGAAACWIST